MWGIERLDLIMRGIGPGELCYISGKAHSGKTQLLLQSVANNPERRVLWVTPDEVAELVLMKLMALTERRHPSRIEELLRHEDEEASTLLHETAERYSNLLVVDQTTTINQMEVALAEAEDHWQAAPDLVVVDFLELIPNDGEYAGVANISRALKSFGKSANVPLCVVHQGSRTGSKRGQAGGMEGMKYGGETDAIYVVEVYRKRDGFDRSSYQYDECSNTITANVAKNKRPPCHIGEVDLYLHPDYGYIREMRDGDVGTPLANARPRRPEGVESQAEMIRRLKTE